ncbi:hypothetical protein MCUN1_003530 [Malassezia cuniculi]|uniref:Urea active transporter n=1 Tax=Malassezia cuniculi TaxID=948313 RepID=A0AAF0J7W5_9BASI|nr:hypothetical protein MCUN1_003530 [Malassezia cuniculi]
MSESSIVPPLSQGWGYGVIIGIGMAFAVVMMGVTHLLRKYAHEDNNSFETYSTAGRSVGVGLTATAVISSWAWSTALLSSSTVTYSYGVGGAYWFGAGCIVQICLFALLAIQSKLKTPHAHTILEVVKVRYGTVAHIVYMALCLINNLIAVINMLLGASASISALTGMHTVASIFLLPVGVCLYTISGGLRATFVTDWAHTVALFIIVLYLALKTLTSEQLGSLHDLWEAVKAAGVQSPVDGNYNGSYLTMTSPSAVEFGILHTLGNFGLVIMDSSYWQKAYSADNAAATPGYLLGGIVYFGLPWCLGTVMGLASIALQHTPDWPTFGRAVTTAEVNSGLILPYAGMTVAGSAGAVAVVIVVFMAVTSTTSAELIAVSSIVSSDIYHTYIRPSASGKSIMVVSHLACVGFTIVSCAVSVAVYYGGGSLTWTLYFLGVITCPGMVTMPLTVLWSRQSKVAAIVSPIVGLFAGLATWLSTAYYYGGEVSVASTGLTLPCVFGTVASAGVPAVLTVILSFVFPDDEPFKWSKFNAIELIEDDSISEDSTPSVDDEKFSETSDPEHAGSAPPELASYKLKPGHIPTAGEVKYMQRMSIVAGSTAAFLFLVIWIIWPFSMYGTRFEFSESFFSGWVVVSLIWVFAGLLVVVFLPPIDGRHKIIQIIRGVTLGK